MLSKHSLGSPLVPLEEPNIAEADGALVLPGYDRRGMRQQMSTGTAGGIPDLRFPSIPIEFGGAYALWPVDVSIFMQHTG